MQTLKAAKITGSQVITANAQRYGSEIQHLGNPAFCGAGPTRLNTDIHGRNVGKTGHHTLDLRNAACSTCNSGLTAKKMIGYENANLPYIPTCAPGQNGGGDTLSVGRNNTPNSIYGGNPRSGYGQTQPQYNCGSGLCPMPPKQKSASYAGMGLGSKIYL